MTEEEYMRRITDLCDLLGLKWHHETDSRKSPKGWPDLVIAGPHQVIFVEVKTDKGKVTKEQREWLLALKKAGASVYIFRPEAWPAVERILRRLAAAA